MLIWHWFMLCVIYVAIEATFKRNQNFKYRVLETAPKYVCVQFEFYHLSDKNSKVDHVADTTNTEEC